MQLIYLSPVERASFSQRPHKFVDWFYAREADNVYWIEPYPTRLIKLTDVYNLFRNFTKIPLPVHKDQAWIKVIKPLALPLEPIPILNLINLIFWNKLIAKIKQFSKKSPTILVIGKPSKLALKLIEKLDVELIIYDAMDDFPAFYNGVSKVTMYATEQLVARRVNKVIVSSTELASKWADLNSVALVKNACDLDLIPNLGAMKTKETPIIFGYVGTVANWFDWSWIVTLARLRPEDEVRIIGPIFNPPTVELPHNVNCFDAIPHDLAIVEMSKFDIGLIPFIDNALTNSVDPIKYYEYRALGLPVFSTNFGEMRYRTDDEGVFVTDKLSDIELKLTKLLSFNQSLESLRRFRVENNWKCRFDSSGI